MKKLIILTALVTLSACSVPESTAESRQAAATKASLNAADREIGMPRIVNFSQRKMLKNAYEDMDQTTLTYVYTQSIDGKFVCLGQGLGYGVMGGTQFTSPHTPTYLNQGGVYERPLAEPNGLYTPSSGAATIVNLIDPATGKARTALVEPSVVTIPFKLPSSVVNVPCPSDIDPNKVVDGKEESQVKQR